MKQGHFNAVRVLCESGADVDKTCQNRKTALFTAARSGHTEVTHELYEHGPDVNKVNVFGHTPPCYFTAVHLNRLDTVQVRCKRGANVNKKYFWKRNTAFPYA